MIAGLMGIVFVAFATEAMSGFGSVMISLAIGTLFWPIGELLPVIVPLSLALSGYMLSRYWRHVDQRIYLRLILPVMGTGVVGGLFLAPSLSGSTLRVLLGIVVMGAAGRGLWANFKAASPTPRTRQPLAVLVWIFVAGIVHGMIATGGPPLVYALEGVGLGKRAFRSTLAAVWFVLNLVLTIGYIRSGALSAPQVTHIGVLVPVVVCAVVVGELLHRYVSETLFRAVVLSLLVFAGVLLWLPVVTG